MQNQSDVIMKNWKLKILPSQVVWTPKGVQSQNPKIVVNKPLSR